MTLQHPPSPGWYDDARGGRRWWDGRSWHGTQAPGAALVPTSVPSVPQPWMAAEPFVAPQVHVVHSAPAKALFHAAQTADLLVVGTRGLGGFKHLLLGSVAEQCIRYASCNVLVVRAGRSR